ncbi:hypothetical protein IQ25_04230 [Novosphingobium taihuense]|nr:hypothetical protein IQ25_04230 [Novosphingobium taihuense]
MPVCPWILVRIIFFSTFFYHFFESESARCVFMKYEPYTRLLRFFCYPLGPFSRILKLLLLPSYLVFFRFFFVISFAVKLAYFRSNVSPSTCSGGHDQCFG